MEIDSLSNYKGINSRDISVSLYAELHEILDFTFILDFVDNYDSTIYLVFLDSIFKAITKNLSLINTSGQYDFYLDLLNNTNIEQQDTSVSININIPKNSFLDYFLGFL